MKERGKTEVQNINLGGENQSEQKQTSREQANQQNCEKLQNHLILPENQTEREVKRERQMHLCAGESVCEREIESHTSLEVSSVELLSKDDLVCELRVRVKVRD